MGVYYGRMDMDKFSDKHNRITLRTLVTRMNEFIVTYPEEAYKIFTNYVVLGKNSSKFIPFVFSDERSKLGSFLGLLNGGFKEQNPGSPYPFTITLSDLNRLVIFNTILENSEFKIDSFIKFLDTFAEDDSNAYCKIMTDDAEKMLYTILTEDYGKIRYKKYV